MPWRAEDAKKHKAGLTPEQAKKWAAIANKVLADCKKEGGSDCEGKAIRIANSKFTEGSMKVTRKVPNNALFFKEPGHFEFADSSPDAPKVFSMVAYSGKPIKGHWIWGDLAIDVSGMEFPKRSFPILEEHFRDVKIGFSKKKPIVENNIIEVTEITLLSNEKAQEFYNNAREGFPYEASISVRPSVIEEIAEGAETEVNGYKMKGPCTVFRKGLVREASVCTFGYDSKTSVSVFNDTEEKELDLEVLKHYDNSSQEVQSSEEELSDTSEGMHHNNEGGKQIMTLEELKEKFPELVASIEKAVTDPLKAELAVRDRQIAVLQEANQQLTDANAASNERIGKLEKSEAIRTERELKARSDEMFAELVSGKEIPERLYPKVRAQIDHSKFVEDGKLNEEKFSAACKAEIESWATELKAAYVGQPPVMGMSTAGDKGNTGQKEKEDELVSRMVGYVVTAAK